MKQPNTNTPVNNNRTRGFTLVELLVVVAIVGILGAITYPSYLEIVKKSRRSDARSALLDQANNLELHFSNSNTYVGYVTSASPEGFYTITVTPTNTTYTLSATGVAGTTQENDDCGTYTYDNTGAKGATPKNGMTVATCW